MSDDQNPFRDRLLAEHRENNAGPAAPQFDDYKPMADPYAARDKDDTYEGPDAVRDAAKELDEAREAKRATEESLLSSSANT